MIRLFDETHLCHPSDRLVRIAVSCAEHRAGLGHGLEPFLSAERADFWRLPEQLGENHGAYTFAERYRNGRFTIPSPILVKAKPHPDGRQDGAIASLTSRVLVLQIKSIEVHDLGPGGDEVGDELRLVVVAGIDLCDGAELGV